MGGKRGLPHDVVDNDWFGAPPPTRWLVALAGGRAIPPSPLDPEELALADRHGLIGLAADGSRQGPGSQLMARYARTEAREAVMEGHLRTILETLAQRGIKAAVLKGPYLARSYYRVPAHRTFTDVDVLVAREDVDRALETLGELSSVGSSIPEKRPKADKRDVPFFDTESGVRFNVDLHWDLFSYTQLRESAGGATAEAWGDAVWAPNHDLGPLWQLPIEAELAFLCTHAWLDHRFRLILFRDLVELTAAGRVDWDRFVTYVTRWGLRSVSYVALLIASKLLGANVPFEVLARLRVSSLPLRAVERMLPRIDFVRFDGRSVRSLNLAAVALHDEASVRRRILFTAPRAFPGWLRRVADERRLEGAASGSVEESLMLVVSSNRRRGAEVFGQQLGNGLAQLGWDAGLVALWTGNDAATIEVEALLDETPRWRFDPRLVFRLRRAIARRRPTVVFANGGATLRYAVIAMSVMRRRPMLAYASIGEPRYWTRSELHEAWVRSLHRRADIVFAVSDATREQLIAEIGLPADRVFTAYTGVAGHFFEIEERESDESLLRVLFLGNLSEEKDPVAAVQVLAALPDSARIRLRFVGSGPLKSRLEEEAARWSLQNTIEIVGSVDDVGPQLEWADVLLLTSRTEGFPGVVLEAAAAGVPAVAFAVGGTDETISDQVSGILVEPGDVRAAADALRRLYDHPDLRREMGRRARDRAKRDYTLEQSVRHHDAILRAALRARQIANEEL